MLFTRCRVDLSKFLLHGDLYRIYWLEAHDGSEAHAFLLERP